MTRLDVPLESIRPAFQGLIPAPIATASADGVPNSTYLSIIWYVDEERIALSNQFMGKTVANLHENPHVALRVVDPTTMAEYEVDATWLRAETSGETYEAVRTQLEAVAAQSGMDQVFRLRAVEILRVDRCVAAANLPVSTLATSSPSDLLSSLDVFVRRLSECRDLAEATRVGLQAIDDLFGFRHSLLLAADDSGDHLFAVASNGYPVSGVGAEVAMDDGVIGVAAHRRRQVWVANLDRLALAGGTGLDPANSHEIPLPGLSDAQSVLATPLLLHDRLIGVLYLDSAEPGHFDADASRLVEVLAGHLAVTIALLEAGGGAEPLVQPRAAATAPPQDAPTIRVAFHEHDGSVLVDGDYVIKGVPGRILISMLEEHARSGRTEFTNREIRLDQSVGLPVGNDNLEARLLTLRRRLADRDDAFRVERVGRGRIELTVDAPLELVRHDDRSR